MINSRCVIKEDLNYFSYNTDFWLDTFDNNLIFTSKGSWGYKSKNPKIYVIPYKVMPPEETSNYSIGDKYNYPESDEEWYVVGFGQYGERIDIIPKTPREIIIDDASTDIYLKAREVTENRIFDPSQTVFENVYQDFISKQIEKVIIYSGHDFIYNTSEYIYTNSEVHYVENGQLFYNNVHYIWKKPNQKILGFRPVLKLKFPNIKAEKKELSNDINNGDYINYNANGYENWRILSMDKSKDTIDIVSGGIVKNITLNGVNDYNNLESIIQTEVDKYKAGEKVESVRATNSDDILSLKKMNDKLSLEYWTSDKKVKKKNNAVNYAGSNTLTMNTLNVGIMYYDYEEDEIIKKWQPLSLTFTSDSEDAANYYRTNGYYINPTTYYEGDYSYTAGLRPIITLKLDSVEKLNDNEVQKIEESSKKIEKVLSREQDNKNNNSLSTKDKTTDTNTSIKSSKSDNNNDEKKTKRESIKTVYKNSPLIITGFVFSLICNFIEFVALLYFFLRMRKVK